MVHNQQAKMIIDRIMREPSYEIDVLEKTTTHVYKEGDTLTLLIRGATPKDFNTHRSSAILCATHPEIGQNHTLPLGFLALQTALKNNWEPVVESCLRGSSTNLATACREGHEEIVKLLLQRSDIDINGYLTEGNPLVEACKKGHKNIIVELLKNDNIKVNGSMKYGIPLVEASRGGYEDIVKLLLEHPDIDVNGRPDEKITPLVAASMEGRENIVKLLLAKNDIRTDDTIPVDNFTKRGSPLVRASKNGHCEIVKLLLENKVELFSKISERTAVVEAWNAGQKGILSLFEKSMKEKKECIKNLLDWSLSGTPVGSHIILYFLDKFEKEMIREVCTSDFPTTSFTDVLLSFTGKSTAEPPAKRRKKACSLCCDKTKEYMCIPCYHLLMCEDCKDKILPTKKCPKCRKPITDIQKIFDSDDDIEDEPTGTSSDVRTV